MAKYDVYDECLCKIPEGQEENPISVCFVLLRMRGPRFNNVCFKVYKDFNALSTVLGLFHFIPFHSILFFYIIY